MTRLCFAIALGMSACQCGSVPADDKPAPMPDSDEPDETDEEYRPSVHNWLPDTRWDCHYNYAQNGTLYRVAHTWQFTETEFRTDCGQQIELAYSNGDINQSVHWDAAYWVLTDEGPQYSDSRTPSPALARGSRSRSLPIGRGRRGGHEAPPCPTPHRLVTSQRSIFGREGPG
jgi:hypothetical protein